MSFSAKSIYTWYRDTIRNPKYRWWLILGTLAYLVSPIDIAPDFIPVIGQIDDIAVLSLLIAEVSQMLSERLRARKGNELRNESSPSQETVVDVSAEKL